MKEEPNSFRFSLKHLVLLTFVASMAFAIPSCAGRRAISQSTLDQLYAEEDTLTRQRVLEIAGEPQYRRGDYKFCYTVWNGAFFFSDMFCIVFDDEGNVTRMSF